MTWFSLICLLALSTSAFALSTYESHSAREPARGYGYAKQQPLFDTTIQQVQQCPNGHFFHTESRRCVRIIKTTGNTMPTSRSLDGADPLSPTRLESIKNSIDEKTLLSKTIPSDFVFDFDKALATAANQAGGRIATATASNFPGLINHGVAMTVGVLGPCGINLPHIHPRATEINYSVDGHFQVGFFPENGGELIMNEIKKNQVAVFPKGAIHFEANLECVPATFVSAFDSEDPGVLTISNAFFDSLPATIVGASLGGLDTTSIEEIRLNLAKSPSSGIAECRKRCGL